MTFDKLLSRLKKYPISVDEFYRLLDACPTTYESPELELELLISNGFPAQIIDDKVTLMTTQTSMKSQQYCFVDLETIGHNANDGQIIEIGAIKYKDGQIIDTFDRLVYASNVPDTVEKVTGITTKNLEDKPRLRDTLEEFKIFLEDDIFVAHNVKFDYEFMSKSFEKYHLGKLENRKLCTIDLSKKIYQTDRYGLASLTRALNIDFKQLHRAYDDAKCSLEVFKLCLDNLPSYISTSNSAEELIDFTKQPLKNQKENPRIVLPKIKRIHFIGIGGIGLSALARKLHNDNQVVSGSDMKHTVLVDKLIEEGIKVSTPHDESNVSKQDIIIYSAVVKDTNVEMQKAKEKGIPTYSRNEALKFLLQDSINYNVCGAHGKSTTTAMLSSILNNANAIIGAESKEFGSNARIIKGSSKIVFEADESDGSFLNSNPYCAIVTNAEPEHMEYYDYDEQRFYNSYKEFLQSANKRIINAEDEFINKISGIKSLENCIKLYPSCDIKNIEFLLKDDEPCTRFELLDLGSFDVWGFGEHIALDASLAILGAIDELLIDEIKSNLLNYKGIKKRFDVLQSNTNFILIDDYAHHPTEIKVSLESLELYKSLKFVDTNQQNDIKKIAIWQPHKYSRTLDNLQAFIDCFGYEGYEVDELVILPVWSAGEEHIDIDFAGLFARYNPIFCDSINATDGQIELIKDDNTIKTYDEGLVIGFGAGDITYQLRGN